MSFLLLVDDDEHTCEAMRRLLGRTGYAVACVCSGAEALALLDDLTPDLVILDWMMPDMDGLEVLRRVRVNAATRDLPVLMYSAADDPKMKREALRLGAMECVLKSGGFFSLYERVEQALADRGAVPSRGAADQSAS